MRRVELLRGAGVVGEEGWSGVTLGGGRQGGELVGGDGALAALQTATDGLDVN